MKCQILIWNEVQMQKNLDNATNNKKNIVKTRIKLLNSSYM